MIEASKNVCENSNDILDSISIHGSEKIRGSISIYVCINVLDSASITNSIYVEDSQSVHNSMCVWSSEFIKDCNYVKKCSFSKNLIFCEGIEYSSGYMIFNQIVSHEDYSDFKQLLFYNGISNYAHYARASKMQGTIKPYPLHLVNADYSSYYGKQITILPKIKESRYYNEKIFNSITDNIFKNIPKTYNIADKGEYYYDEFNIDKAIINSSELPF